MPLQLSIRLEQPTVSALQGFKAVAVLHNPDRTTYTLPGPASRANAFSIEIFAEDGAFLKRVDGLTQQIMLTSARPKSSLSMVELAPNTDCTWEIDLASYDYCLAPGAYQIRARFRWPPADVDVVSSAEAARVTALTVRDVQAFHDDPILEGLCLLIRSGDTNSSSFFLRQHNFGRPLASWYSEPLPLRASAQAPFCATPEFFGAEDFDIFFSKWVVARDGNDVVAQNFLRGTELQQQVAGELPADEKLLRFASFDARGRLKLFTRSDTSGLCCYSLTGEGLEKRFEYPLPPRATHLAVRSNARFFHIAWLDRGLHYARLGRAGNELERLCLMRSRYAPHSCDIDPMRKHLKAAFLDRKGRSLQLVSAGPSRDRVVTKTHEQVAVRGAIQELAFATDKHERFHTLVASSAGKLFYIRPTGGKQGKRSDTLIPIASGRASFFPVVASNVRTYLGFCESSGYRFLEVSKHRRGRGIIDYGTPR